MPSAEHEHVIATLSPRARPADLSFDERQAGFQQAAAQLFPVLAADVRQDAVDAGGVPAEWVLAAGSGEERVILYLHGGGYTQGSPATHRELASRVSRYCGAQVLSIDYRLAPAHPFPAAVEDALTAYRWLVGSGRSPKRMAIAGDSAGGGLALAFLMALRDAGDPLPACAVCLSPWFDLEGAGASALADDDPIVERQHLIDVGKVYLAGAAPRSPLASPLHGDLGGLPPLLLQVGDRDLLLDDSRRLAEKARAAGVDVELQIWAGLIHVWHIWGDAIPEAKDALKGIGSFVAQNLPAA